MHEILNYIANRHQEKREWNLMPDGVDLGDTYPTVPCPTCAASWYEGCCRTGFCPERVAPMEYYESLPSAERKRISEEDWQRYLKHRRAKEAAENQKNSPQLTLFE